MISRIRHFIAASHSRLRLPDAFGFHSDSLPGLNTAIIVPRHKIATRAQAELLDVYSFGSVDFLHLGATTWATQGIRSHHLRETRAPQALHRRGYSVKGLSPSSM